MPFNLLPHLRWLTEGNYGHVYYMDGKPRVSDVRIFNAEAACGTAAAPTPTAAGCIHPNGWGTIMVVGMRLGGGELKLPTQTLAVTKTEFSGFNPAPPAEMAFRSAYVVLDITNPEAPPTVLAELTDTTGKLGFTTGLPVVAAFTQRSVISATGDTVTSVAPLPTMNDKWYLVFGNGPNAANTSSSTQPGAVFVYDLRARSYVTGYNPLVLSASPSSFVGDPAAVDWDLNFANDALYFGTVGGTAAAPTGQLYKINTNGSSNPLTWAAPEVLLNPGGPVTSTPSVTLDESGNRWIYAGTGRFYIQGDKSSSPAQTLFGVIDTPGTLPVPAPTAKVPYANLVDTTNAVVTTAGTVLGVATPAACSAAPITNTLALGNCAVAQRGWKYRLGSGSPSERIVNRTSLLGEVLFTTAFTPSPTLCEGEGSSRLLGLDFKTGAAKATVPTFSATTTTGTTVINGTTVGAGTTVVNGSVDLGQGLAAGVALHLDNIASLNRRQVSVISQTSTAAVTNTKGNLTATVDSAEIDWRDSRRTR